MVYLEQEEHDRAGSFSQVLRESFVDEGPYVLSLVMYVLASETLSNFRFVLCYCKVNMAIAFRLTVATSACLLSALAFFTGKRVGDNVLALYAVAAVAEVLALAMVAGVSKLYKCCQHSRAQKRNNLTM